MTKGGKKAEPVAKVEEVEDEEEEEEEEEEDDEDECANTYTASRRMR